MTSSAKDLHNQHAAALWRAIALRRLHGYRAATHNANVHGDDLKGLIEPPEYDEITRAYKGIIEQYLPESIDETVEARCSLDLLAAITEERFFAEIYQDGAVVFEEEDQADQVRLISRLSDWINRVEIAEALQKERARFAAQGSPRDADLLVAERELAELQRKRKARGPLSDAAAGELNDEENRIEERINTTAPATIAGALVKLRHFLSSSSGQGWTGVGDDERASLQQIADFLEREGRA